MPLKRGAFVVRVDSSTGIVGMSFRWIVAARVPTKRYLLLLGHDVSICERFNIFDC